MKPLWVVFLLISCSTFLGAQPQLQVSETATFPGAQITIPIYLENGSDLSAIQFTLSYDPLSLTPVPGSMIGGDSFEDHALALNQADGNFSVLIFSASLASFRSDGTTLMTVQFEVDSEVLPGTRLALTLSAARGADLDGISMPLSQVSGGITMMEASPFPVDGENELLFPQIANGGGIRILLVLVNRSAFASVTEIRFFKPDGTPFELFLTDGRMGDSFLSEVPPGGSVFLASDGTGEQSAGYARLSATHPVGAVLLFTIDDGSGGVLAEAGVTDSPRGRHFSAPVLLTPTANTGLAAANISTADGTLTFILREETGEELARTEIPLTAGFHAARFLTQFFESALAGITDFQGSIEVVSDTDVTVVALKQEGFLLTTFPVVILAEEPPS